MRSLVEGLAWMTGWAREWDVPTKAALFKARSAAGAGAAEGAVRDGGGAAGDCSDPGAWYRGWRLMSIDGTCLDVADTAATRRLRPAGHPGAERGPGRSRSCAWWGWPSAAPTR